MAEGSVCVRHSAVYPENGDAQDNVPNAIETRDIVIEARIETDNVHIQTEIYSTTHLDVPSDMDYEDRAILRSSRSKNVVTEDCDTSCCATSIKHSFSSMESKERQYSKIEPVDSPSEGPHKYSWDEGSRIRSEAKKYLETKEPMCHPDCSQLHISRSTQLEMGDEIEITFEECVMSTATQMDKASMCSKNVEDTASNLNQRPASIPSLNLATIPEEGSVFSTRASEPSISASMVSDATQCTDDGQVVATEQEDYENDENVYEPSISVSMVPTATQCTDDGQVITTGQEDYENDENVYEPSILVSTVPSAAQYTEDGQVITTEQEDYENDENVYSTDEEYIGDAQEDAEFSDTERLVPDNGEKEAAVETDSIYATDSQERQIKLKEPGQWTSGAWIKSPSPTRLVEAETRSCARLIRSFSSQLNREERCCETRCAPYSSISCAASSKRLCNDESSRRSGAKRFCSADYCSPKSSLAFGTLREPSTYDRLARYHSDRYGACNRYHSNLNKAYRESNDGWCPNDHACHVAHTSQYTARTSMTYYTPSYYSSCNAWY